MMTWNSIGWQDLLKKANDPINDVISEIVYHLKIGYLKREFLLI